MNMINTTTNKFQNNNFEVFIDAKIEALSKNEKSIN